ncbi:MAG: 23S rRNA (adenine(1618)-N(6))-methyltransferase RlmF, partial [Bacteroidia bacterium]|nr:23S rRNA (adenine(1618)-N(6))-methyltransferase RlmF [Bacteroidia bacterium]
LKESCPELTPFVKRNIYGDWSIDFFDPAAVKMLNNALLLHYYKIDYWDIPQDYLCPPIPGRADYIHHVADLMTHTNKKLLKGKIPTGSKITCLDIGVGANCVYPIIGCAEYGWSFIGSDIDKMALKSAEKIIDLNASLKGKVELRWQSNPRNTFKGIIQKNEYIDISICNPPFYDSAEEAQSQKLRKLKNLKDGLAPKPVFNFGGQNKELWTEGGEAAFVKNMIYQSKACSTSCFWYSALISKESNLSRIYQILNNAEAVDIKTIPMAQGNKVSRIVAWTFLTPKQQQVWIETRWK